MKIENNIPNPEYRKERERQSLRRVQIIQTDGELVQWLEKISRQLDDIIIRLPAPPPRDLGKNPDNFYDQTAVDENYKYPTAYVSVPTKTSDSTNE